MRPLQFVLTLFLLVSSSLAFSFHPSLVLSPSFLPSRSSSRLLVSPTSSPPSTPLHPLNGQLLVSVLPPPSRTAGGLHLPKPSRGSSPPSVVGLVLAGGPGPVGGGPTLAVYPRYKSSEFDGPTAVGGVASSPSSPTPKHALLPSSSVLLTASSSPESWTSPSSTGLLRSSAVSASPDRVLVECLPDRPSSSSGLVIIPPSGSTPAFAPTVVAVVRSVGPPSAQLLSESSPSSCVSPTVRESASRRLSALKALVVGDVVRVGAYAGDEVPVEGEGGDGGKNTWKVVLVDDVLGKY